MAEALTPVRVTAQAIEPGVVLVESAYRGDASRAGWTTEAVTTFVASVQLVRTSEREAYLGMFAVSPDQQGSGLGSRLMAWAENWVRSQWGVRSIKMTVIRQRSELIEFYRRRGYEPTGGGN